MLEVEKVSEILILRKYEVSRNTSTASLLENNGALHHEKSLLALSRNHNLANRKMFVN